jgi:hypothetical protein
MSEDGRSGRLSPGVAIGLAILALVLAAMWMRGCWDSPHGGTSLIFPGFRFYGPLSIWGLLQAVLAVWVGLDASKRGLNGVLWGLLVFFTGVVGLIVYLLVGPVMQRNEAEGESGAVTVPTIPTAPTGGAVRPKGDRRCLGCEARVDPEFKVCPYCGCSLRCAQCDRSIEAGWKVCPHCATPIAQR